MPQCRVCRGRGEIPVNRKGKIVWVQCGNCRGRGWV